MKIKITSIPNKYSNGGQVDSMNGMHLKKDLISFSTGGTHEDNPNGGIMQGIGANGQPNLVEQGETKHDNYIFSDRLKIDKNIQQAYRLPKSTIGKSFADASKIINKETKERPNDIISKNGQKAMLSTLTEAQEALKQQDQIDQQDNEKINVLGHGDSIFAKGGQIHIKKENRGKFTEAAKRAGMGVQEYAHHVMAHSHNAALRKRANFAIQSKR